MKIKLDILEKSDLYRNDDILLAYRHLYWACSQGSLFIINHIITKYQISPFFAEKKDGKSPFMTAIENDQDRVVSLLLKNRYTCRYGSDYIDK